MTEQTEKQIENAQSQGASIMTDEKGNVLYLFPEDEADRRSVIRDECELTNLRSHGDELIGHKFAILDQLPTDSVGALPAIHQLKSLSEQHLVVASNNQTHSPIPNDL